MIRKPIIFRPFYKRTIWGGTDIFALKGERAACTDLGETWELSDLSGSESVVADGPYEGTPLSALIARFGADLLGGKVCAKSGERFPLLVKFIDAREDLSIQVHPDDELALRRHNCPGKTEMWYVVKSDCDAKIYAGLHPEAGRADVSRGIADGSFASLVKAYNSRPGDVFFIQPGTVHAIGAGNLVLEIQQPCDITYRIFDYDRTDAVGNKRELHTDLALDSIRFGSRSESLVNNGPCKSNACTLVECPYFTTVRHNVDGEAPLQLKEGAFTAAICIEGTVEIRCEEGAVTLRAGHTVLIPACCSEAYVAGHATLITTTP